MMARHGGAPGGGAPGAGAPQPQGAGGAAEGGASPAAAPMSSPQEKQGLKAAANNNIHIAVNMLEEALPAFGAESKEGNEIISALKILGKLIAKKDTSDLVPAEIMQMVQQLPQMGGGSDIQRAIMQQMQQPQKPPQQAGAPAGA